MPVVGDIPHMVVVVEEEEGMAKTDKQKERGRARRFNVIQAIL